jgi:hypothetical protein
MGLLELFRFQFFDVPGELFESVKKLGVPGVLVTGHSAFQEKRAARF